jgi:hypothetical protein
MPHHPDRRLVDHVTPDRDYGYQVHEALSGAADLAASVHAFAAQLEAEEAFGLLRDRLLPHLPDALDPASPAFYGGEVFRAGTSPP